MASLLGLILQRGAVGGGTGRDLDGGMGGERRGMLGSAERGESDESEGEA